MTFLPPQEERRRSGADRFLKIVSGVPVCIQIMDEHPELILKHWMTDGSGRRIGLRCPGPDVCPICLRNRELNYDRDNPSFISLSRRYRVNVLDMTAVLRCECGATYIYNSENPRKRCVSDACGADLSETEPTPLMGVKILERGRRLMEQIDGLEAVPHTFTGKTEKVQDYPIVLVATGQGKDMTIAVIPQMPADINLNDFAEYKHDLKGDLVLEPEEINHLLEGGNYSDILAARRADREASRVDPRPADRPMGSTGVSSGIPF